MEGDLKQNEEGEDLEQKEMKRIKTLLFSGGTYQIEIKDEPTHWIFVQVDDEGNLLDQFCTCKEGEETKSCIHLSVGKKSIFQGGVRPLHVRFRLSFYNALFSLVAEHLGYKIKIAPDALYEIKNGEEKILFSLKPLSQEAKEKLKEIIDDRKEETEETSLKFSNLDEEELIKWQEGNPSKSLLYELSLWSDLAKWLFWLEERDQKPHIVFENNQQSLPKQMTMTFRGMLEISLYLISSDWPKILPKLPPYRTNLPIYEFRDIRVEKILYDTQHKRFEIISSPLKGGSKESDVEWEDWIFRKGIGFFSKRSDHLLTEKYISEEKISEFLDKYRNLIEEHLVSTTISSKLHKASYQLFFDKEGNFHIECYLFEPGDLKKGESAFFEPWCYLEGKGFFRLTNLLFRGREKIIPKEHMNEFIERNRHWLNKHEEFKIHLSSLETKLTYSFDETGLKIMSEDQFLDRSHESIDFGEWIYIQGEGFFSRARGIKSQKGLEPIEVPRENVSEFIKAHLDELETIKGFFYPDAGLEKTGLIVTFDGENIIVEPKYYFKAWALQEKPEIVQDFIYIPKKGFASIPDTMKIPEKFDRLIRVSLDQIPYFIKHELKRLKPYILHLDKKLIEPTKLKLGIKTVERQGKNWVIDFHYVSSLGEVKLRDVFKALASFAPFMLSEAGMIQLKDKRFHWLIRLIESMFQEGSNRIVLSTLDWIRLNVFEEVHIQETGDPELQKTIKELKSILEEHHLGDSPNLKGFKSKLRPYQEIGVRWLWFLYTYGLSGFLCDEMGLGKTHQAMALMASIMNLKKRKERAKFLVVCPTSVAYHWEELLKQFFQKIKVHFYHGPFRDPKRLNLKFDVILTTYGILRSDKELFQKMQFELAIFDEMQVAKNQKSQIHTILKQIQSEMKLALTGTPIENALLELKSLFDIVLPGYLPHMAEFKEEYILPIEKDRDLVKQKRLQTLVNPFILRRRKSDVLQDLPEKIEEISYVELSDEQRKLYQEIALQSKSVLNEEGRDFYMHVFALLSKLKQVCDHPTLIYKDFLTFEGHQSGKWEHFVELLDEIRSSKQKVVVFSQYLEMLDIIEQYLKKENIGFAGIRGVTKNRKEEIDRFQNDPNCEVFVASLQAAGVGIDLTRASVVIHYDRWWNPARENQATDRVHRIGQTRGVSVFKFVTKDTIEEHIHHIIERKKDLIQGIIGFDSENDLKKLDKTELQNLLKKIYSEDIK